MGARRKANGEGKGGSRRKGKPRGHREEGGGQHLLPLFRVVSNGAACAAPFLCLSNGGSICCPCFSSFRTGQHLLPCFFSFLFLYPPITGGI
jgi:hypothetical protein